MVEISDLELVAQFRQGHNDAYAELIRRHHARVSGLCLSMLRGQAEADDAAQEVFLKAHQALSKFRSDSAFSSWLYRIAANHCLDILRLKAREKTESLDALMEGDTAREFPDPIPDFSAAAESADLVARALARLPEQYRLILDLREVQGMDYEEIADTLECSLDAVKARLQRARRNFAEILRHLLAPRSVSRMEKP